jgi:hypothetical protein
MYEPLSKHLVLGELMYGLSSLLKGLQQQPVIHSLTCHSKRYEVPVDLRSVCHVMLACSLL